MPKKPKYNDDYPIFESEEELVRFVIATISDCAAVGEVLQNKKLSQADRDTMSNNGFNGAYARIQACMVGYERMRRQGLIRDIGEGMILQGEEQEMRDKVLKFMNDVLEDEKDGK